MFVAARSVARLALGDPFADCAASGHVFMEYFEVAAQSEGSRALVRVPTLRDSDIARDFHARLATETGWRLEHGLPQLPLTAAGAALVAALLVSWLDMRGDTEDGTERLRVGLSVATGVAAAATIGALAFTVAGHLHPPLSESCVHLALVRAPDEDGTAFFDAFVVPARASADWILCARALGPPWAVHAAPTSPRPLVSGSPPPLDPSSCWVELGPLLNSITIYVVVVTALAGAAALAALAPMLLTVPRPPARPGPAARRRGHAAPDCPAPDALL
jgi:hypothetical protein